MSDNVLSIQNIYKSFKNNKEVKNVLNDFSLNVKESSIFGLVGLNGMGKTTMIKIMLDMMSADSGNVEFFGINSKNYLSRQLICYLPEKFQPSPYLTGYDFLEIAVSFFNKELNKKKAEIIAENIDLDPKVLSIKAGKYSKGMGQKLGLIACMLSNVRLLILDEPMSGLDPKSRIMLKNTLKAYKESGSSIFFSSHILEDIGEICDDIAVLHNCKIKFRGHPDLLKSEYQSQNAERAFLNCINLRAYFFLVSQD